MKRWVLLWIASLIVVALASFSIAQAQTGERVLTGGDIGVRLDGVDHRGKPTGALVVRVNGSWVEVVPGMVTRPAK